MNKLKLDLEHLAVESFGVEGEPPQRRGTVRGNATMYGGPCIEYMTDEYASCQQTACGCTVQGCYSGACPTAYTCAPRYTCDTLCLDDGDHTLDINVCP